MADKKYQVFISSTYSDLVEERRKILDILLMADCIPAGMEAFVASDVEQFEVIKKVIRLCDYYLLIIGKRYGSISEQTGLSYTEMEYEYAKELGIPVLVFALDESIDVPEEKRDTAPAKIASLKRFREKAMTNRLASIWKTPDELTGAVAISIMRAKSEIDRPGWQRATEYDEVMLRRQIMTLQEENQQLKDDLALAKQELDDLNHPNNISFYDCIFTIKYSKRVANFAPSHGSTKRALPDLFQIISMEMLDVALTENSIRDILRNKLFPENSYQYSFDDPQLIKTILLQLQALNLISSTWSSEKSKLFWQLTKKGKRLRADMMLIKTPVSLQDKC